MFTALLVYCVACWVWYYFTFWKKRGGLMMGLDGLILVVFPFAPLLLPISVVKEGWARVRRWWCK